MKMILKKVLFSCRLRSVAATALDGVPALPILALGLALATTGCGKTAAPANAEVTVAEMNQAMRMMSTSPMGAPQTVDELTNFPAFKGRPFPAPPAGKRFSINPITRQVVTVNQ